MVTKNFAIMVCRTIMALWKARSLSPEQKVQLVEEESETKSLRTEDNGSFLGITEAKMSEVFSSTIPLNVSYISLCTNCKNNMRTGSFKAFFFFVCELKVRWDCVS